MRNGAEYIRRELMIRMVRAFDFGELPEELDRLPVKLRPKNMDSSRCCIYRDRAVLKYRLMALMGVGCENEVDEARTASSYLEDMRSPREHLSVCAAGCSGCEDSKFIVTGNCRGCFSRLCLHSCPRGAITVENQVSRIDYDKCVKCGKCQECCPFRAIVKVTVPCEEACPVDAIRKNAHGIARIDFNRCIYCGRCLKYCPFGAVMERSEMIRILYALENEKLIALVAPSAEAQFSGTLEQLFGAIARLGFAGIMEVALGAEETAAHEAAEFAEKMAAGEPLMTTSCCPSYVELVRKHVPELLERVSHTPSPMVFTARMAKELYPGAGTVFIGPCLAKRREAREVPEVDYVLSFEELGSMLAGRGIDVIAEEPYPLERPAADDARNFARSCGVSRAVLAELTRSDPDFKLEGNSIDGVDKKTVAYLKACAAGKIKGNFLEVMACRGGCVNGPGSLSPGD